MTGVPCPPLHHSGHGTPVASLPRHGDLTASGPPIDRRVPYANLTDRGRAKLDEAAQVPAANLRSVFADFSDGDRSALDALLDRLRTVREPDLAAGR